MNALINGSAYSWSDIKINIFNTRVVGIDALKYSEEEEIVDNFGAGNRPVSRSYGAITTEGSITLHMEEIEALQAASPSGRLQDIEPFDIIVAFLPKNGVVRTHTLKNCQFMSNGRELTQGESKIAQEITLAIAEIKWK